MATRQPAPSPVLASQPQAPRCVMRTSISSASVTQLRVATLSRLPAWADVYFTPLPAIGKPAGASCEGGS